LKRFLVRELDQQDISTHGLTFTIKTNREMFLFTSIVIEKNKDIENSERYNVLHAKNFNPNNCVYQTYSHGVRREVIPALLIELSKLYFRQLNPEREQVSNRSRLRLAGGGADRFRAYAVVRRHARLGDARRAGKSDQLLVIGALYLRRRFALRRIASVATA
jgi:hypothetical protein